MTVRRLTAHDLDEVVALFEQAFPLFPVGHLARRSRDDLARILRSENVSAGIFSGDMLVGYQLWNLAADLAYDARRYSKVADIAAGERVLFNKGTVIAPAWQSRGLARRLERYTFELARDEGYLHRFGQILISNTAAVRLYLAVGRSLVGLSTDEFGLNFISHTGLGGPVRRVARGECAIDDVGQIGKVLEHFDIFSSRGRDAAVVLVYGEEAKI